MNNMKQIFNMYRMISTNKCDDGEDIHGKLQR
jgi:hypothetical protein